METFVYLNSLQIWQRTHIPYHTVQYSTCIGSQIRIGFAYYTEGLAAVAVIILIEISNYTQPRMAQRLAQLTMKTRRMLQAKRMPRKRKRLQILTMARNGQTNKW